MSSSSKSSFFRQSSWMVIATFTGGICMTLVHSVASKMPTADYSTFVALLRFLIIMGIPAAALQTIFSRQAAAALTEEDEEKLAGTTRAVLAGTFGIWLVSTIAITLAAKPISHLLKVSNPLALVFTMFLVLTSLWVPLLKGLLQGRHRFLGVGWLLILDGIIRFGSVIVIVLFLHGRAAGGMLACFCGQFVNVLIGCWLVRGILRHRGAPFESRAWLGHAIPLTLGMGTIIMLQSLDTLFVQGLFADGKKTALYGGAMLTGYAIVQFVAPVANVMFPRIVRSAAKSEPTDSLRMTLWATAVFGCVSAIGCTIVPALPLRIIFFKKPELWAAAPLVPWFAWALVPNTLANVLVQNVLAHGRFKAVPKLVIVALLYGLTLVWQAPRLVTMEPILAFVRVVQTLGVFSFLLCAVAAWYTWREVGAGKTVGE